MLYKIAGHIVEIDYGVEKLRKILPNLTPFEQKDGVGEEVLMRLVLDQSLRMVPEKECHLIRDVDTGNGMTRVDRLADGYQFFIRDINGNECGLLRADTHFKRSRVALNGDLGTVRFALNNALMLAFAFSAAYHDTLLIHASVVRHADKAYAFTAKSGTGKSTQVANWLRYIEGCDLVNDDNPIIRMVEGKPVLYGSPWSGKTPCYRNIEMPLGAVLLIERDNHNYVERVAPLKAFATLLAACSAMKWDEQLYSHICDIVINFVESGINIATLHCLPDADSAIKCCDYLEGNSTLNDEQ